ncbi:PREDICTED: uncharacterized protein LOC106746053 isoform X2 [Dinoponera quadriceps]|uniref:Uncharacterized protein LOC106746053 isoform X2 n=1 Tax=Dinoponera quadriceps TaxID=609295 RepID=A0A6P3XI81_DINQU|nr:PREDICTED: uncharacterized protein LOC106746053 isoform X2 [Dinoponera quadriceps]
MGRICCISGCTSGRDAPSHQIPKNPELFKKWKSMIYSEKIQHLTDEQISKPIQRELISESDTNVNISTEITSTIKTEETFVPGLFEDLPETLEPPLLKQPSTLQVISEVDQQLDMSMNQTSLTVYKTSHRSRIMTRKQTRLTEKQLILLKCKKQAEIYTKTPTIQKLLSSLTATKKSFLQNNIRRSKYFPRTYIKLYHDIAKAKALGQL